MNTVRIVPFVCLLAACAAPHVAERTAPVPLGAPATVPGPVEYRRADADKSPPRPMAELPPLSESMVSFRTVTETVAAPAEASPVQPTASAGWAYDPYDPYGYAPRYDRYRYGYRDRELSFPVNTLVGFGIGSAFGHHHHHRGHGHHHRGALLGGGLGLVLDLHRIWR
jgi:hypothetical protein